MSERARLGAATLCSAIVVLVAAILLIVDGRDPGAEPAEGGTTTTSVTVESDAPEPIPSESVAPQPSDVSSSSVPSRLPTVIPGESSGE